MSVRKTTRECYEVRARDESGDWGNITLLCWQRDRHDGVYYCGEITIHSSFGTWAHTWTACAVPFKRFLIGLEFGYCFGKFMGAALDCFDGEASVKAVREEILRRRRDNGIDAGEAREAWDLVDDYANDAMGDESAFGYAMHNIHDDLWVGNRMAEYFSDCMDWPHITRPDHQAVGFWEKIWPEFVKALRVEVEHPDAELVSVF